MRFTFWTVSVLLAISEICTAGWMPANYDFGAPEVKNALKFEIRFVTNAVAIGAPIPVLATIENTSTLDVWLPSPPTFQPEMQVSVFLIAQQSTGGVQSLILPRIVLPNTPTPRQKAIIDEKPVEVWHLLIELIPAKWIRILPHGKEEFRIFAVAPRTKDGNLATLDQKAYGVKLHNLQSHPEWRQLTSVVPGIYDLRCEIDYFMQHGSAAELVTNQLTSVEAIRNAKTAGVVLIDAHRLWTGKMQSNIASFTLTTNSANRVGSQLH